VLAAGGSLLRGNTFPLRDGFFLAHGGIYQRPMSLAVAFILTAASLAAAALSLAYALAHR
jgi:hypothetical protein